MASQQGTPLYLTTSYHDNPKQKGGTLIAPGVDKPTHDRMICDPDGYRPEACPRCGNTLLHMHDFRYRNLKEGKETKEECTRRYECMFCNAIWHILPGFIARWLHRSWDVVQSTMMAAGVIAASGEEREIDTPKTTVRRWKDRLLFCATILMRAFQALGVDLSKVLSRIGIDATRARFVDAMAQVGVSACRKLEEMAEWIHRLIPGWRLM
jgi:hypothetical protein